MGMLRGCSVVRVEQVDQNVAIIRKDLTRGFGKALIYGRL